MFILYKLCVFKSPIQIKLLFLLLLFCSKNQPHDIWRVTLLSIFVSWIQVQVRQAVPPTHILQVTLSVSIWALKSPSRTSKSPAVAHFSTPVRDLKKARYSARLTQRRRESTFSFSGENPNVQSLNYIYPPESNPSLADWFLNPSCGLRWAQLDLAGITWPQVLGSG